MQESKTTKKQVREYRTEYEEDGQRYKIKAGVRWDDECGNGHNSFAITGAIYRFDDWRREYVAERGGCIHEEIAKHFPDLAPYIKWHLFDPNGPMYYTANTVYHAGDRDHWGKLKGEPRGWETHIQFGANPIKHALNDCFVKFLQGCNGNYDLKVIRLDHRDRGQPGKYQFRPTYTFGGYGNEWHQGPFHYQDEALDFLTALQTCNPKFVEVTTQWGEGKERHLDAARGAAVWPEATDEQLMLPKEELTKLLEARLPKLLEDFHKAVVELGFEW